MSIDCVFSCWQLEHGLPSCIRCVEAISHARLCIDHDVGSSCWHLGVSADFYGQLVDFGLYGVGSIGVHVYRGCLNNYIFPENGEAVVSGCYMCQVDEAVGCGVAWQFVCSAIFPGYIGLRVWQGVVRVVGN